MTILVVGASGATGKHLIQQLLDRGDQVKVIVRKQSNLPKEILNYPSLTIIQASILDLSNAEINHLVKGCQAIASCLGHNLTFKGIYGQPRQLVTEATQRLCQAIVANQFSSPANARRIRFVLMNTAGNSNRDLEEKVSWAHQSVISLLRILLPPHVDNEKAADYLRTEIGKDHPQIEWAVVRPDGLINQEQVSDYTLHDSPTRCAIFNAGTTSRINVANFMARLISDPQLWSSWRGKMPVIYNSEVKNS